MSDDENSESDGESSQQFLDKLLDAREGKILTYYDKASDSTLAIFFVINIHNFWPAILVIPLRGHPLSNYAKGRREGG